MKKSIFIFLALLSCCFRVNAQNKQIDSLLKIVNSPPSKKMHDSSRVKANILLSEKYFDIKDSVNGFKYEKNGILLLQKNGNKQEEVNFYLDRSYRYIQLGDLTNALIYCNKCNNILEFINGDSRYWYIKGFIYYSIYKQKEQKNKESSSRKLALECFKKNVEGGKNDELSKQSRIGIKSLCASLYNDAIILMDTVNYAKAKSMFGVFFEYYLIGDTSKANFKSKYIETKLAFASMYMEFSNNNKDKAKRYSYDTLAIREFEEVLKIDPNNEKANYNRAVITANAAIYDVHAFERITDELEKEKKIKELELEKKTIEALLIADGVKVLQKDIRLKESELKLKQTLADKKSKEINLLNVKNELLNKDKQISNNEILEQKKMRNIFVVGLMLMLIFSTIILRSLFIRNKQHKIIIEQKKVVEFEKQRSEGLLLNILPSEVAEELKEKGNAVAKNYSDVSVLFTDFKGFTRVSEKMKPEELVYELHHCFSAFDKISQKFGLEKIKTIGDSYMAVAGLPKVSEENAVDAVRAGIAMSNFMNKYNEKKKAQGKEIFEMRVGVHSGPVVAGIVGIKKFAYDIWGDTVNTASRMESNGEVGKVNISETTYELVKNYFTCTHRGKITVKNKGDIDMYFVEGKILGAHIL